MCCLAHLKQLERATYLPVELVELEKVQSMHVSGRSRDALGQELKPIF